ncbi:hypothetical protein [Frigidibacter sp.]|uniref:hypothetical protein n=1 Tax=Frigidibacter sp. TaxID=2586418 RepID=UPI0027359142|nr:hypothetical protein [Frigidibacter sp.]MDP3341336.1 hypothetical protein [Frigidibacter sp.]
MHSILGKILGSIATKIAVIVVTLAGLAATAVAVGFVVFSSVAKDMTYLAEEQIPALKTRTEVIAIASRLNDALVGMLQAPDATALDQAAQGANASTEALTALMEKLPEDTVAALEPHTGAMGTALKKLQAARLREFVSKAAIERVKAEVEALFYATGITLTEQADNAFFDAAIAAEIEAADRAQPSTLGAIVPSGPPPKPRMCRRRSSGSALPMTSTSR